LIIEFWRADNPSWLFLTVNQWISIASMAVGILIAIRSRTAGKRS
jgi:prolipoprotein diacylglyceryltransferase